MTAVSSLDLEVPRGEMFGLIGPDGAGKSTAIRMLCGLVRPTGGEGRVLGHDLLRDGARLKARIGYLSQAFTLYGDLTVDENLSFFGDLHGVDRYRVGLLHAGRVLLTGTPDEIKAAIPGSVFDLVAADPRAAYACLRATWSSAHLVLLGDRVRFWSPAGEPDADACVSALDAAGLGPVSRTRVNPTLEDAFVGLLEAGARNSVN